GPTPSRMSFPTHAEAIGETKRAHGMLMDVVAKVSDDHMSLEVDHPRLGKQTLGGILGIVAFHLTDHAGQLKTLRGG
ncbi:MAG TPA: DinB family protein, partial [Tepidiformaceae bacterium]|nr:DinB family protein [Tepidiformaceae bacterium]